MYTSAAQQMSEPNPAADMTLLRALSVQYPDAHSALAEIAALRAQLMLPKSTVHVISDVHGEYKKLRHVINNASGNLRPLVEKILNGRLSAEDERMFLSVLYYPRDFYELWRDELADRELRTQFVRRTLRLQFEIVRALAGNYRRGQLESLYPPAWRELFSELFNEACTARNASYVNTMLDELGAQESDWEIVRAASHLIRNLAAAEIIVAGDVGDRGERIDKVIDYLREQPHVAFTWGNHDVSWLGACLGQEALIATVLRVSIRYRRLSQLEEGYGIMCEPLEKLARDVYGDDAAERFKAKGTPGLREDLMMARMQKAISVIQFKLEGQTIKRHPEWQMDARNLLERIDLARGTVMIEGTEYPLRDANLPTLDPANPYELTPAEAACMARLKQSFVASERLWQQMLYLVQRGAMWLRRDDALIFHACTPVDERGEFLPLAVDGTEYRGRALFDALETVVRRAYRKGFETATDDEKDWFWYLWTGERSPLFGKDRMATFETYFVEDKATHKENKNPYFKLIHEKDFCLRVAREFGGDAQTLIVNGHVPVKIEQGEQPVKKSGMAVTIDGAFSEAYGDRGYTLILAPERIALAEHHHFESVAAALKTGADIVPTVADLRVYDPPRAIADTEDGAAIRAQINALESLREAYDAGRIA